MLSAFTYHGELAVAGLNWEQRPERLSPRQIGLRWGASFALVNDIALLERPSLLSLLLSRVPAEHCAEDLSSPMQIPSRAFTLAPWSQTAHR